MKSAACVRNPADLVAAGSSTSGVNSRATWGAPKNVRLRRAASLQPLIAVAQDSSMMSRR